MYRSYTLRKIRKFPQKTFSEVDPSLFYFIHFMWFSTECKENANALPRHHKLTSLTMRRSVYEYVPYIGRIYM